MELELPMMPHAVLGHPEIEATEGKVALMRGPVIYCMEETDNSDYFSESEEYHVHFDVLTSEFDKDLLGGVVALKSKTSSSANNTLNVTYVPYYSWANRDNGKMKVWAPYK